MSPGAFTLKGNLVHDERINISSFLFLLHLHLASLGAFVGVQGRGFDYKFEASERLDDNF